MHRQCCRLGCAPGCPLLWGLCCWSLPLGALVAADRKRRERFAGASDVLGSPAYSSVGGSPHLHYHLNLRALRQQFPVQGEPVRELPAAVLREVETLAGHSRLSIAVFAEPAHLTEALHARICGGVYVDAPSVKAAIRISPALVFVLADVARVEMVTEATASFDSSVTRADDVEFRDWYEVDVCAAPEEVLASPFRRLAQETQGAAAARHRSR